MICLHDWRFPGKEMLDPGICSKCKREGVQWYDFLSGGVTLLRGRAPSTDLRLVYLHPQPARENALAQMSEVPFVFANFVFALSLLATVVVLVVR